jgi:hypothetical protein
MIRRLIGLLPHALNQTLVKKLYGREEVDTFPAFYRMNTERRIWQQCLQAGLKLVGVQRYADPGYFRFAGVLENAAILADWLLEALRAGCGRLYVTFSIEKPALANDTRLAA